MSKQLILFRRRKARVRYSIRQKSGGRVRLSVFRSGKHIYAQIIDDSQHLTLTQASTMDAEVKETLKSGSTLEAAERVGALIAARAKHLNIEKVVFDRGGYLYHGRVKALGEKARESGLSF